MRKLLLNLEDVTQLDSLGISAIVGTYVSLSRQGGSLKLLCPCGRVQEVLRVIRVADIIPTFEGETQALASFRPQGYAAKALMRFVAGPTRLDDGDFSLVFVRRLEYLGAKKS